MILFGNEYNEKIRILLVTTTGLEKKKVFQPYY